jgi:hypothetical protein
MTRLLRLTQYVLAGVSVGVLFAEHVLHVGTHVHVVAASVAIVCVVWPWVSQLASRCRRGDPRRVARALDRLRRLALGTTVVLLVALISASSAFADPGQFGKNLGEQVKSLSTGLFLAVAGLVTLPILGRRDVNGGVVLAGLVIVLGGFIFAQDMVKHVITDLWQTLPDSA